MSLWTDEEPDVTDAEVEGPTDLLEMSRNFGSSQSDDRKPVDCRSWDYDRFPNVRDQMETNLKVLQLELESKLPLTQVNGQRKLGPPLEWKGPVPGRKCEIFVARLPKTIYEHEIFPVFSTVGQIYEIRLMMDFSATNRGYCFIMYSKATEAERAVKELDQYEIVPGRRIGVVASLNKCRLYIDRLPPDVDSESVIKKIYAITDDVEKVAVYRTANGNVSYALISYKTHRGAAMGRRRLVPETMSLFENTDVTVKWADPSMTPLNVFEESGTCDEDGNIEITTTFLPSNENRKAQMRKFDNYGHKRGLYICDKSPNRRATLRPIASCSRNNCLDNVSERNVKKIFGRSTERFSERNYPQSLLRTHYEFVKLAQNKCSRKENLLLRNINGNHRYIVDRRRACQNSEFNCPHSECLDTASPLIPNYPKDCESIKKLHFKRVNGTVQEGYMGNNFAERSPGFCNKYNAECTCQCKFRDEEVLSSRVSAARANFENHHFDYPDKQSSVDKLVPTFSGALNLTNGTDTSSDYVHFKENAHQTDYFAYPSQIVHSWATYNPNAGNGVAYVDQFQNPRRAENDMAYCNSALGYPTQDNVEESRTNTFLDPSFYDSLNSQSNDFGSISPNCSMFLAPNTKHLSNQPHYYNEQVLDNVNSLSDKKPVGFPRNTRGMAQQGNIHINHAQGFASEGLSVPFTSDGTVVTSKQILKDDEVQRFLRPIVNGTTANIKLRY